MPLIPPDATSGTIDILLPHWRDNGPFRGFVTMIRDCNFITNKPRVILESMKVEGWRLVEKSVGSGNLMPIDEDSVVVSSIAHMLNERDLSSIVEAKARVLSKSNDDFNTNESVDSSQSICTPSVQPKTTPHAATEHYAKAGGSTGESNAAKKMASRGTLMNDPVPLDRALTPARESNAKRTYQRRNSVVLPPRENQNTLPSLNLTVNIIPTDDPTMEEIHRVVLANAIALQTHEELYGLCNAEAEASQYNTGLLDNHAGSESRSGIPKNSRVDTMAKTAEKVYLGDLVDATSEVGATGDLESLCRVKHPSAASREVKISQSKRLASVIQPPIGDSQNKRLASVIQPPIGDSLQEEVVEGASIKRSFLDLEQCIPPRALVSVVSPCNDIGETNMVDLEKASMQIDSTFFSETESICSESKTLQAKGSGRHLPKLAMRKLSRVDNTKSETSSNINLELHEDPKDSTRTEGKRFKRSDQSVQDAHEQTFEAARSSIVRKGGNLSYAFKPGSKTGSQTTSIAPLTNGDASARFPAAGNLVRMQPRVEVLDAIPLPALPNQACDVLFCETYDGRRNNHVGNVRFLTFLLGIIDEFGRHYHGDIGTVASKITACFVLNNPNVRFLLSYGTNRDAMRMALWHQLSFSEAVQVTALILVNIWEELNTREGDECQARHSRPFADRGLRHL